MYRGEVRASSSQRLASPMVRKLYRMIYERYFKTDQCMWLNHLNHDPLGESYEWTFIRPCEACNSSFSENGFKKNKFCAQTICWMLITIPLWKEKKREIVVKSKLMWWNFISLYSITLKLEQGSTINVLPLIPWWIRVLLQCSGDQGIAISQV